MSGMFYEYEVESLDLPSFDTSNVMNIFQIFNECKAESLKATDERILGEWRG